MIAPAPGGQRRAAAATLFLLLPAVLLLAGAFLVPLVRLIGLSLSAPAGRLAPYAELIGNDVYRKVFVNTFSFAVVVTAVALVLAFPLALALRPASRQAGTPDAVTLLALQQAHIDLHSGIILHHVRPPRRAREPREGS